MHPFTITDQMVDDTLTTALEGGITYWATGAKILGEWPTGDSRYATEGCPSDLYLSEVLTKGSTILIEVDEELVDGDKVHLHNPLDLRRMKRGIRKYCEMRHITPSAIDDDPVDAEGADVIVQLALFGEVIFG